MEPKGSLSYSQEPATGPEQPKLKIKVLEWQIVRHLDTELIINEYVNKAATSTTPPPKKIYNRRKSQDIETVSCGVSKPINSTSFGNPDGTIRGWITEEQNKDDPTLSLSIYIYI
jgi:hypothetical protein